MAAVNKQERGSQLAPLPMKEQPWKSINIEGTKQLRPKETSMDTFVGIDEFTMLMCLYQIDRKFVFILFLDYI